MRARKTPQTPTAPGGLTKPPRQLLEKGKKKQADKKEAKISTRLKSDRRKVEKA